MPKQKRPGNPGLAYNTETYAVRLEPKQVVWLDRETQRMRLPNRSAALREVLDFVKALRDREDTLG